MRSAVALARENDRLGRIEIVTEYAGSDGRLIRLLMEDGPPDGIGRVLLMLALTRTRDPVELQTYFDR